MTRSNGNLAEASGVSATMKPIRRWGLVLALINVLTAGFMIVVEEGHQWQFFTQRQRIENSIRERNPGSLNHHIEEWGWPSTKLPPLADYWPSMSEHFVYSIDLPAWLLVGWCGHPTNLALGLSFRPFLYFSLRPIATHTAVKTRVVILDMVLLLVVGLQWWVLGSIAQRKLHPSNLPRWLFPGMLITGSGVVVAAATVFAELWPPAAFLMSVTAVATLVALIGWLVWVSGFVTMLAVAGWRKVFRRVQHDSCR